MQEVERYIGTPGQLRARAETTLGPAFDLRAFHNEVLLHGAVLLDVLDAAVTRWIAAQRKG